MANRKLSLSDKIQNENLRKSLSQILETESRLKNELSKISSSGKSPINKLFYVGSFLFPLLIYIGNILLQDDTKRRPDGIGDILGGLIIALLFWIIYLGSYIGTPYCIFMSIKELIRTPKRERYVEINKQLENLELEKKSLESKIKY